MTVTIEGNKVALKAEGMDVPVACRYAFCGKPDVNLTNDTGFPAYPFRTDTWPQ